MVESADHLNSVFARVITMEMDVLKSAPVKMGDAIMVSSLISFIDFPIGRKRRTQ